MIGKRWWFLDLMEEQFLRDRCAFVGSFALEQEVECCSQTVDVSPDIDIAALDALLRGNVIGGAEHSTVVKIAGQVVLPFNVVEAGQAKIEELGNQLVWETRIFEDRRRVVKFVCEVPTAIDQRLFALGRTIQQEME